MRIKNNRLARDINSVNGFTVCAFAAASLIFAVLTLIFGTDGDVYRLHLFPKLFVSMFCYSLVFISEMLFLGAFVGLCIGDRCCAGAAETVVYGVSAIICTAAAIPLMFQTDAFFYAFLLLVASACFFLMLTARAETGNGVSTVLTVLCGVGAAYQIYISFSMMLLN